jgi:electron transfer flavoprotein alpha subunit
MAGQVFAYISHRQGKADDVAFELAKAAGKIYPDTAVTAIVTGAGSDLDAVCNEMAAFYKEVWKFDDEALAYPNAEAIRTLLVTVLPRDAVIFIGHDTLKVIRQEYSGQVSTHVSCDISAGAIINIRPGTFPADETGSAGGQVVDKSADAGDLTAGRRFLEVVQAEVGDVDITKEDVLVSVGRGIEDQDNIEIADELAEAIGAVVSCSRPIVDAKWLEKSRQVGTSGQTVKPKVYLALGISGSFQHLGGLKGNPFIVAVNKNPKAPIFQVADIGVVEDLLDFVPVLTEKIQEGK